MICYGLVNGGTWQQEHYETASRDAGKRAKQLRKLGFRVTVCPLGMQVTKAGLVKMTMVDVRGIVGMNEIPAPEKIERL